MMTIVFSRLTAKVLRAKRSSSGATRLVSCLYEQGTDPEHNPDQPIFSW